ncbi:MAG: EF-P lysine aminoacylase GenX, partial [Alphaproteobacteria bacterium]
MPETLPTDPPFPWRSPQNHADRAPFLRVRGALTRALRNWFECQGFTEVETAALQVSPGNEA